ncbi:KH domain-containing protein [Candidatus Gracilibacteria bacterium 28_42_T64]|nr:KH domain-containing protein [Candidatus Gracilibacteria bacterium 28_42_T64]
MTEVDFLQFIIENLVENKDDIKIERTEDELGILLTLSVNKEDMGIIIGKGGNTINSIRSILRLFGMKNSKRLNLKVLD